jgi:hypothetical protein
VKIKGSRRCAKNVSNSDWVCGNAVTGQQLGDAPVRLAAPANGVINPDFPI